MENSDTYQVFGTPFFKATVYDIFKNGEKFLTSYLAEPLTRDQAIAICNLLNNFENAKAKGESKEACSKGHQGQDGKDG